MRAWYQTRDRNGQLMQSRPVTIRENANPAVDGQPGMNSVRDILCWPRRVRSVKVTYHDGTSVQWSTDHIRDVAVSSDRMWCMSNCQVIRGRKMHHSDCPILNKERDR